MYGYGYNTNGVILSPSNVFLFMNGQSGSRGEGTPFPVDLQGDIANVEIWNGTAFETLNGSVDNNNQLGQPQGKFGAEMSLLKTLTQTYDTVYCMKYAIGSSGLATVAQGGSVDNWNPNEVGVGRYYPDLIAEINQALAVLPSNTTILGFFHYQGEADGLTSTVADLYFTNLNTFVNAIRTDANLPDLKFYITRILNITDAGASLHTPVVRTCQTKYAYDNYGDAYLISVDDLGIAGDLTHLTAQGYVDLGNRYASALATPPSQVSLLLSEDFPGVTLANKNWAVTGTGITVNNKAIFTQAHSGTITFDTGRKITSRYIMPALTGTMYGRVKMSWTDPVMTNQSSGGFLAYNDASNYIGIMTDAPTGANSIRIRRRIAGVNTDTPVAAVNGDDFKIMMNNITGAYQIWYWSAGAWVSLGTGTGFTGRFRFICTTNDSATFTGGDEYYFENFDIAVANFTTLRPTL